MSDWKIYHGDGVPTPDRIRGLPEPPPWRNFNFLSESRAKTFLPPHGVVEVVNAALYLRRPILVTGDPGTGKSSLAYAVAHELDLGEVLFWPINSRSTLIDGLYQYDALARLRQASIERARTSGDGQAHQENLLSEDLGRYIKLGPLGTAFLARDRPRVVLIDEIDKSDVDLPNDLLHVLENGDFEIPELTRISEETPEVEVTVSDPGAGRQRIERGHVRCCMFPFIIITSNRERDLPPAFLRRCLRIDLPHPNPDELRKIVQRHLGMSDEAKLEELLSKFEKRRQQGMVLATDQLLNAFYMLAQGRSMSAKDRDLIEQVLLRELDVR
ncbi:MAG TPA: MoxR family ATPase [Thermoanaerobaculia bacterium]